MKERNFRAVMAAVVIASLMLLVGCGGSNVRDDEAVYPGAGDQAGNTSGLDGNRDTSGLNSDAMNARGLKGVNEDDRNMFVDPNNPLSKRIVYFAFDSDAVTPEYKTILKAHAAYAVKNGKTIRLEGHTDERGTREYNIGLSERRAQAVQRVLMLDGMAKSNLPILAFGEERPAELGHNPSAWSKNRRVELIYVD